MIDRRFCHHDPVEYEYEYRCTEYEYDCPGEQGGVPVRANEPVLKGNLTCARPVTWVDGRTR